MSKLPTVRLRDGGDRRVRAGHLWVFSNELMSGFQSYEPGSPVVVEDYRGKVVGTGLLNPHSLIAVRLYSQDACELTADFFRARIRIAKQFRERHFQGETAYRVIYGESDGIPGLIVDRFDSCLVLQTTTIGIESKLGLIVQLLIDEFTPACVLAANDGSVRRLEGLALERKPLFGRVDEPLLFMQDQLSFAALPVSGQKTGFFLDQRLNRKLTQRFVTRSVRVLDLFAYTGAFGMYALQSGAESATLVDDSAIALDAARVSATQNGFADRVETIDADVFEFLKSRESVYDVICLDPPALAKSRLKVDSARRAYRDLNARALARLIPGGILATSSCSGLVSWDAWKEALREGARKSGRRVRLLALGGQAPDHPILAAMPETEYLKFAVLTAE